MEYNELKVILNKLDIETELLVVREGKTKNTKQVSIKCPLAKWHHKKGTDSSPSLSIKFGRGCVPTLYKCFSCLAQGKLWDLVDSYANLTHNEDLEILAAQLCTEDTPTLSSIIDAATYDLDNYVQSSAHEEARPMSLDLIDRSRFPRAWSIKQAREYLINREVSEDISDLFDLRYDPRQNRLIFPIMGQRGELYGLVGRTMGDDERKYKNYFGAQNGLTLGGLNRLRGFKDLCIVEGFFCLLRGYSFNMADFVCTWHAEMTEIQSRLVMAIDANKCLCYDGDTAGNTGVKKAIRQLESEYNVKRLILPENKDVGNLTKEEFTECFKHRKRL